MKGKQFTQITLCLLLIACSSVAALNLEFKLGAISLKDRRFIFPTQGQYNIPVGTSLEKHTGAVTVEPRLNFIRNHDENCSSPTRGRFTNHDEIFWYCANADPTKPGEIRVAKPEIPGKRHKVTFAAVPNKNDFLFIIPLTKAGTAAIVAKTATAGTYDIYISSGKLDKPLVTGDTKFNDATKLRAIIAPKASKKEQDLYFYLENVDQGTDMFKYEIDKKAFVKIVLKTMDEPMSELKRIMHLNVSENYISMTGVFGVKNDGLKFIFFQADEKAVNQIQKKDKLLTYREVPQEGGKTETSATALAWAFKSVPANADVLIFNKTPKDTKLKSYIQFGFIDKDSQNKVNDHLKTYIFDKEHDLHKKYVIHEVAMAKTLVRFAWKDPATKDIKTVWETRWGNKQHAIALTKAEIQPGIKELIFVYPSYIVGVMAHFEFNFHHFNYVFNPEKIEKSKREPGTDHNFEIDVTSPHLEDYEMHKLNVKYQIVDTKQMKTYSQDDANKATISAIKGTLIEFQIPELNFRGNNIAYSADMKDHGIMISKNDFNVVAEKTTDKVQILDDLFGQSVAGKVYSIHTCDMVIINDIKVKCAKAAKDVTYTSGDLKQLAQVNSIHGIYTAFESKGTNKAKIPLVKFIKKTHDKNESLEIVEMDFSKDLASTEAPDLVSMGIGEKKVTVFAVKGGKVSKREINNLEGKSTEAFDIAEYIPSFKGKTCSPKEISKTDFYDKSNKLVNRAHITYECAGIKTIVDWRNKLEEGKPNVREIINYKGTNDMKTCVTKSGILELNTKDKILTLRSFSNGEMIDYGVNDYGFKEIQELICDHPGEGHALVQGTNPDNKVHYIMINLNVRDPLGLVFHKFAAPFTNVESLHSSRYMNYFLLTFTQKTSNQKHWMLLNPGNIEVRVKAKDKPYEIKFKAIGHAGSTKKEFKLDMTIVGNDVKTTTVEQFKGQYTEFNEKKRYDLDQYLKFNGPVKNIEVIIPDKLKTKVSHAANANKSRIEILPASPQNPDITIVIPSAQITKLVHSEGVYLIFRSNEFETEVKEIYKNVNDQYVYYVQEPCEDISFDSKSGNGTVVLSCPKSSDIIIHTERIGEGRLTKKNVRYLAPSKGSSVSHIDKGIAVLARTMKTSDSEVTIQIEKVDASKPAKAGKERRYMFPISTANIEASAIFSSFTIGDKAAIVYSKIFSDKISFKHEIGVDKTTKKAKFVSYDLVRGEALKGVVSRLGCRTFDGAKSNQKIVNCWAYTNENMVYLLKVDCEISADGELHLNNIYRNFYNTGMEQYITGCVVSDEFLVCSSDNLSSEKSRERTSVLVFRIYNTTTWKNYYEYAKLTPKDLKDVTPFISTLTFFDKASKRVLSDVFDEHAYWNQQRRFLGKSRILAGDNKAYDQQTLSIYGAYKDGVKRHIFKVSPTTITTSTTNVQKDNLAEFNKIEVKVTGLDGKDTKYTLGSLKKDTKADPVVPDEKREKTSSSNSDSNPDAGKGLGFFGWFFIIVFLAFIVVGAWYFVRREQIKNEAREKMIDDTPEMESYA